MKPNETLPAGLPPHVLRDYALLADGERGALVGPRGERQLRGNLPQAFVHALLIESAARLTRPWDTP